MQWSDSIEQQRILVIKDIEEKENLSSGQAGIEQKYTEYSQQSYMSIQLFLKKEPTPLLQGMGRWCTDSILWAIAS